MFRVTHVERSRVEWIMEWSGVEGGIHVAMLMLAIADDEEEAFKMTPTAALATLLLPSTRLLFFVSFEGRK